jgi:ribosomal protein S18 acetylase RimI-like enzyme
MGCGFRPCRHRLGPSQNSRVTGRCAGLYNVATLAAYRRRGVATALTARALTSAQAAGMRNIELQPSAEGRVIYERLGFRTHGAWIEYPPKNR